MLALLVVLALLRADYRSQMDLAAGQAVGSSAQTFRSLLDRDVAMLSAVLETLASRDDLREALARQDRERLLELTTPLFTDLRARYGITHLNYIDAGGTILLRSQDPSNYGDKLTRTVFRIAQQTGGYGVGLDLGSTAYALRVVHPVYAASGESGQGSGVDATGPAIGHVEVGEEITHFLSIMKQQGGDDLVMLLAKDRLDHSMWAAYRARQGLSDDWDERTGYVVASATSDDLAAGLDFTAQAASLPGAGRAFSVVSGDDGRLEARGSFPITDASGAVSGVVLVEHDLTAFADRLHATQARVVAAVALITIVLAGTIVLLLNRMVFSRLRRLVEAKEPVSSGLAGGLFPASSGHGRRVDEMEWFEDQLARHRAELEFKSMLLEDATDSIVVHDFEGRIMYANTAAAAARGYTREEFLEMSVYSMVSPRSVPSFAAHMETLVQKRRVIFESEDLAKDGQAIPVEIHARLIEAHDTMMVASVIRDLTERKSAEDTIERLAYYDPLTGLANRRLFDDRLSIALAHSQDGRAVGDHVRGHRRVQGDQRFSGALCGRLRDTYDRSAAHCARP